MTIAYAIGCSHTAGDGVTAAECYVRLLADHYAIPVVNRGTGGGNHTHVEHHLVNALKNLTPKFIVLQWPNPFRKTFWINGSPSKRNIHNANPVFNDLLKLGDKNFYEPWLQTIITCNMLCNLAKVPVVNILLESLGQGYLDRLRDENITLHYDEKLPGKTWFFDSEGTDMRHHSGKCHIAWTQRLIGLIDEVTTR